MSDRPFIAARVEQVINRDVETVLRAAGWREAVVAYPGYGSSGSVRVMARVVLLPPKAGGAVIRDFEKLMRRRGWRNFMACPVVHAPVRLTVGGRTMLVYTDRGGYVDVQVTDHGLEPGWRDVTVQARTSEPTQVPVQIVADDVKFGIISDVDDTIISTWLPRLLLAAYNSFVLTEQARQAVPGMAELYRRLLEEHPGAPIFYVSTGSWDTEPFLERFVERNGFPRGAFLLSDWGPTNTGWFRSGQDHKRRALRELARDFPKIKWVLVGDDGQHDPALYFEFAGHLPKRVRAIALRQLTPAEQLLAHGSMDPLDDEDPEIPGFSTGVRGPDGHALAAGLEKALSKRKKNKLDDEDDAPASSPGPYTTPAGEPAAQLSADGSQPQPEPLHRAPVDERD